MGLLWSVSLKLSVLSPERQNTLYFGADILGALFLNGKFKYIQLGISFWHAVK